MWFSPPELFCSSPWSFVIFYASRLNSELLASPINFPSSSNSSHLGWCNSLWALSSPWGPLWSPCSIIFMFTSFLDSSHSVDSAFSLSSHTTTASSCYCLYLAQDQVPTPSSEHGQWMHFFYFWVCMKMHLWVLHSEKTWKVSHWSHVVHAPNTQKLSISCFLKISANVEDERKHFSPNFSIN